MLGSITNSTEPIQAVIGSYADYISFHFSLDPSGKWTPDYSLGEFILPPGKSAKQLALESFGVFVKEEDFA